MRVIRRGVTLVELLVVAFVVSVLLLITVPVIRHFKVKHDDLVNIRNMGATMQDFYAWANDHDSRWPNAGLPSSPLIRHYYDDALAPHDAHFDYFNQDIQWPEVLSLARMTPSAHWHSTRGFDEPDAQDAWLAARGNVAYAQAATFYRFPVPLRTEWDAWTNPASTTYDSYAHFLARARLVRTTDVRHPSAKGVLVHTRPLAGSHWHVALADGHALRFSPTETMPTAVHPLASSGQPGAPVFATLHGAHGRDLP